MEQKQRGVMCRGLQRQNEQGLTTLEHEGPANPCHAAAPLNTKEQ